MLEHSLFHWCSRWSHQTFSGLKGYLPISLSGHLWLDWGSKMVSHKKWSLKYILQAPHISRGYFLKVSVYLFYLFKISFKVCTHRSKLQLSSQLCKEQCSPTDPWMSWLQRHLSAVTETQSMAVWALLLSSPLCFCLEVAKHVIWESKSFFNLLLKVLYRKSYKGESMRKSYRLIREKSLGNVWKKWSKKFTQKR